MKKPLLIILLLLIFIISGISFLVVKSSRDVVSAFGKMDEALQQKNYSVQKNNDSLLALIENEELLVKALRVDSITTSFKEYIESIKQEMLGEKDPQNYELMGEPNTIFFTGNGFSEKGKEFVEKIDQLRETLLIMAETSELKSEITNALSTGQVRDRDGRRRDWLMFNFKDFPLVASITKLTQMQSDVTSIESSIFLGYIEK
ncbi:hypothetical protein J8L88_07600 [Aquimarina sp. MMG015]|uniref:hypothetical protein n=1 Tax=Aquimarina TaxID=290174 RepID=UPI0003FA499B|nr:MULTISPECIES: hypothetical protein [Aquimarina]AXT56688.1 hypothetical protein D1815_13360 [Aquimarina sp. AD1]MBQ4802707.1 hypothetical protein [Aquimarina sp. MMG015]RKN27225.1 hypothetical protein D7035_08900 [Aquimarina sp. AD1]